jgi:Xaa-Pro aminopeptidase
MPISRQEYERRYIAIRELMVRDELDCLVIFGLGDDFNRGNIRYITGSGRGGCCVFPLEDQPVFFIDPIQSNSPKIRKIFEAVDLLKLRETADYILQVGKEVSRFYRGNKIGIVGMGCMQVPIYLNLIELFGPKLVEAVSIFEQVRAIKSEEEIEKIRIAATVADNVFDQLMATIKPGISDYEIYGMVKNIIYSYGCDYSFDLIDAEGGKMNMTYWPTGERLRDNSTIFMEITPAFEGYYAQLPVTLPVGSYPPVIRKMVATWKKTNELAITLLRPKTRVSDLYHCLIKSVEEDGFISPLRPGHAIGLDALDFWSITASSPIVLQAGMTLAVHPSIMTELGGNACGMGYTYLITPDGPERLSRVNLSDLL